MLDMNIEKVGFIIELLREYAVLVAPSGLHDGENASDHGSISVLEDTEDNPVIEELTDFISNLNADDKIELVALLWVGRGDFTEDEWTEARNLAEDEHEGHATAAYVMGTPKASEFIEEALSMMGYSLTEAEDNFRA